MSTELIEKTIGGYELAAEIGVEGEATVYRAYQPHLERWVAVKVFPSHKHLSNFLQNAQKISQLRHRNIIIIYDYGEQEDQCYLVMEYVEGGTLLHQITSKPLDWIRAIDLLLPIAEALTYAHSNGIIHNNIKSSNILIPQDNWPLLTDFNLSEQPRPLTVQPNTPLRSVAYLAPERIPNQHVDFRSDIYSFGVVLFEAITGRLPFIADDPRNILSSHTTASVPSLRQFNPQCPPILELIVSTAMQKQPEQRYSNMDRMVTALKDALASSDVRPIFYKLSHTTPTYHTDLLDSTQLVQAPVQRSVQTSPPPAKGRFFLIEQQMTIPFPDKESLIIGRTHRDKIADIDLGPHGAARAGISRQHARITRRPEGWVIDDLNSLNGTFVNNVRLEPNAPPTVLKNGDEIRCGQMALLFLTSTGS